MNRHWMILAVSTLVLSGCVVAVGEDVVREDRQRWQQVERDNRAAIEFLELGMSIDAVRQEMPHPPAFSEAFVRDDIAYRVLFFRTQRLQGDGVTTLDETTPLIFANGRLDAWGMSAWHKVMP